MRLEDIEYRKSVGVSKPLWDLAIEVVQLSGWDWLDGARTLGVWTHEGACLRSGRSLIFAKRAAAGEAIATTDFGNAVRVKPNHGLIPDLTHPATGGALMALLGDDSWRVAPISRGKYQWWNRHNCVKGVTPYLAEACARVAAMEGRWRGGVDV